MDRLLLNREGELEKLGVALDDAFSGCGQIVLIAGEPGIGKTTLALEFADRAAKRNARVLWGRSGDRHGSPPYWPWAEALRAFADQERVADLQILFGSDARHIAAILPELRERRRGRKSGPTGADDSERLRGADAVRGFLQRTARERAVVLVLEDLHWADRGSLFLLEFIAQDVGAHPLLVLATYRDGEVAAPLAQMLGELARVGVPRIVLNGLTVDGASRLLTRLTGRPLAVRTVREIHARTGGNPFFVTETARGDVRDPRAIPGNVRLAISKRLDHLSALTNQTLTAAAVIGREFDFPLLRAVLPDASEDALLRAIDESLHAVVIEPLPARGAEWYQFRHALIRDAIYESISPSRRVRWHATIARCLETLPGDGADDRAAELAQNAACAGALIEPAMLAKYSCIAGERLLSVHAFEEALSHFERASQAREGLPFDLAAATTLVGLGRAQAATAARWNRQQGWLTLRRAIDYYMQVGDTCRAVAVATDPHISAEGAADVAATIRRIRNVTPPGSLEEGWLLARIGAAEYFETGDYQAAQSAFARALRIAADAQSSALELRTLAYAISIDHFDLRWPELLAKSRRVRELAQRVDDIRSETYARFREAYTLTHLGRAEEGAFVSDTALALAERLKDRGLLLDALYVKSTLAQMRGDWREARAYNDRALTLSAHQIPFLMARVLLEGETGRRNAGDLYLQRLEAAEQRAGPWPLAGACTAISASHAGCLWNDNKVCDTALRASRAVLERRPPTRLAQVIARSSRGLIAVRRSSPEVCEEELEFLAPFKGMVLTPSLIADRLLGSLAHGAGQPTRAIDHFENALELCRRGGYRPEMAWTMYAYSKALVDIRRGDHQKKAAIL